MCGIWDYKSSFIGSLISTVLWTIFSFTWLYQLLVPHLGKYWQNCILQKNYCLGKSVERKQQFFKITNSSGVLLSLMMGWEQCVLRELGFCCTLSYWFVSFLFAPWDAWLWSPVFSGRHEQIAKQKLPFSLIEFWNVYFLSIINKACWKLLSPT